MTDAKATEKVEMTEQNPVKLFDDLVHPQLTGSQLTKEQKREKFSLLSDYLMYGENGLRTALAKAHFVFLYEIYTEKHSDVEFQARFAVVRDYLVRVDKLNEKRKKLVVAKPTEKVGEKKLDINKATFEQLHACVFSDWLCHRILEYLESNHVEDIAEIGKYARGMDSNVQEELEKHFAVY